MKLYIIIFIVLIFLVVSLCGIQVYQKYNTDFVAQIKGTPIVISELEINADNAILKSNNIYREYSIENEHTFLFFNDLEYYNIEQKLLYKGFTFSCKYFGKNDSKGSGYNIELSSQNNPKYRLYVIPVWDLYTEDYILFKSFYGKFNHSILFYEKSDI